MVKDCNEGMSQLQTSLPVANALHNLQVFFNVFNIIKNGGDFLEVSVTKRQKNVRQSYKWYNMEIS
jgi:hypothetical protein